MKTNPQTAAPETGSGAAANLYRHFLRQYTDKAEHRASRCPLTEQPLQSKHVALLDFLSGSGASPEALSELLENIAPDLYAAFELELEALQMVYMLAEENGRRRHE